MKRDMTRYAPAKANISIKIFYPNEIQSNGSVLVAYLIFFF